MNADILMLFYDSVRFITGSELMCVCVSLSSVQLLAVCLLSEGQKLYLHWSHKVTALYLSHTLFLSTAESMYLFKVQSFTDSLRIVFEDVTAAF